MKGLLAVLLGIFLLVDVFLAIFLFNPSILSFPFKHSVTVTSTIPQTKASIANKEYLDKKLDEINFWDENRINLFNKRLTKVTVSRIEFELTDKPQSLGARSDTGKTEDTLYSYGQQFNESSGVMKIIIHLNPVFQPTASLDQRYSGVALLALFDLAQDYPRKSDEEYNRALKNFTIELYENPKTTSFIAISQP